MLAMLVLLEEHRWQSLLTTVFKGHKCKVYFCLPPLLIEFFLGGGGSIFVWLPACVLACKHPNETHAARQCWTLWLWCAIQARVGPNKKFYRKRVQKRGGGGGSIWKSGGGGSQHCCPTCCHMASRAHTVAAAGLHWPSLAAALTLTQSMRSGTHSTALSPPGRKVAHEMFARVHRKGRRAPDSDGTFGLDGLLGPSLPHTTPTGSIG